MQTIHVLRIVEAVVLHDSKVSKIMNEKLRFVRSHQQHRFMLSARKKIVEDRVHSRRHRNIVS